MMGRRILYVLILSSISLVATVAISLLIQPQPAEEPFGVAGFKMSESSLGELVSLAAAQQNALFSFEAPNNLPGGTSLDRVYLPATRDVVFLFYNNPNLPPFSGSGGVTTSLQIIASFVGDVVDEDIGEDIPIVVKVIEDGEERIVAEIPQDEVSAPVIVCGVEGEGNDPSSTQNGLLRWNKDGVHYLIKSRISLDRLISIANSMC